MVFFNHLLMLLLIDIFNYTLCKIGECHRYGSNDWFCCNNYEMRENICVECRPGYTSFSRKSCVPCPKNSYGRRCAEICSCTELERCDYIKGCVNDSSEDIVTTETYIEECRLGYTSAINKPCVPCSDNSYGKRCTERCACTEVERCDHIMGCVYASSAVNTTNKNDIEGSNQHIMIYIVCAGSFFLLFIMSVVCILKKDTIVDILSRNTKKTSETEKGIILTFKNGEHLENCASTYDIIDEHYVFSNVLQSVTV